MQVISKTKTTAGQTVVIRETPQEKGERVIAILEKNLKNASVLERKSIQKKIDAWKEKVKN
jgi:hypothetical protein